MFFIKIKKVEYDCGEWLNFNDLIPEEALEKIDEGKPYIVKFENFKEFAENTIDFIIEQGSPNDEAFVDWEEGKFYAKITIYGSTYYPYEEYIKIKFDYLNEKQKQLILQQIEKETKEKEANLPRKFEIDIEFDCKNFDIRIEETDKIEPCDFCDRGTYWNKDEWIELLLEKGTMIVCENCLRELSFSYTQEKWIGCLCCGRYSGYTLYFKSNLNEKGDGEINVEIDWVHPSKYSFEVENFSIKT